MKNTTGEYGNMTCGRCGKFHESADKPIEGCLYNIIDWLIVECPACPPRKPAKLEGFTFEFAHGGGR